MTKTQILSVWEVQVPRSFSCLNYLSRWLECNSLGMLVRTQEFSGKPENIVGRIGGAVQAMAEKSEKSFGFHKMALAS